MTSPNPPDVDFYRAFRASMRAYLLATKTYSELKAGHLAEHPNDRILAERMASADVRVKEAKADQGFFGHEVVMYGIAYLVEATARQLRSIEGVDGGPEQ